LMGPEGRALSLAKGGGFAAEHWLENDGDLASQEAAAARPGFTGPKEARKFLLAGLSGVALQGRGALEALPAACAAHDLVVIAERVEVLQEGGCELIDQNRLRQTGALALRVVEDRVEVAATRARAR